MEIDRYVFRIKLSGGFRSSCYNYESRVVFGVGVGVLGVVRYHHEFSIFRSHYLGIIKYLFTV